MCVVIVLCCSRCQWRDCSPQFLNASALLLLSVVFVHKGGLFQTGVLEIGEFQWVTGKSITANDCSRSQNYTKTSIDTNYRHKDSKDYMLSHGKEERIFH